jgi:hypothetical protein
MTTRPHGLWIALLVVAGLGAERPASAPARPASPDANAPAAVVPGAATPTTVQDRGGSSIRTEDRPEAPRDRWSPLVRVRTADLRLLEGSLDGFSIDAGLALRDVRELEQQTDPAGAERPRGAGSAAHSLGAPPTDAPRPTGHRSLVLPTADLVTIELLAPDDTSSPDGVEVRTVHGDRLHGELIPGAENGLRLRMVGVGTVAIPFEELAGLYRLADTPRSPIVSLRDGPAPPEDRALLSNGDWLSRIVLAQSSETAMLEGPLGQQSIPVARIAAMRLAAARVAVPGVLHARVHLSGHDDVAARTVSWETAGLTITPLFGESWLVEPERVRRIEIVGGRWQWLSGREPVSDQHTPMLSVDWSYRLDRSVLGGAIRVAGVRYERGIGVHSRSRLIYDLPEAATELVTWFGMDDDSGPAADVDVAIHVDGQARFERQHIKPGVLHGPIRLPLKGAQHIGLFVDFGANGDIQDRFDWVETAIVR